MKGNVLMLVCTALICLMAVCLFAFRSPRAASVDMVMQPDSINKLSEGLTETPTFFMQFVEPEADIDFKIVEVLPEPDRIFAIVELSD